MDAGKWAKEIWENASDNWITRQQDKNYRDYLVHPSLKKELREICAESGIVIDVGCGDGTETYFLKEILEKKGFAKFYGFDTNQNFIDAARNTQNNIFFDSGEISDLLDKHALEGKADLVTSLFVLHDTPKVKKIIASAYDSLRPGGQILALIVHPQFGNILLDKREIKVNKEMRPKDDEHFIYSAEYPIVEVGKQPFYVPYFQRNLSDYVDLLERYFHIETVKGLKPSKELLKNASQEKLLPFCNSEYNVYWPEISEISSSVIIRGVKR